MNVHKLRITRCYNCEEHQIYSEVYVHVTVHRNKFLFNKPNKTHEFPKFYFVKKTPHVSGISFAHQQGFSTVHLTLVYFLQV